jgi:hypothetical protein
MEVGEISLSVLNKQVALTALVADAKSLSDMDFTSIMYGNRDVHNRNVTKEYVDTASLNPSPGMTKDTHVRHQVRRSQETCMADDMAEPFWLLDSTRQDATRPSNNSGQYSDDSIGGRGPGNRSILLDPLHPRALLWPSCSEKDLFSGMEVETIGA